MNFRLRMSLANIRHCLASHGVFEIDLFKLALFLVADPCLICLRLRLRELQSFNVILALFLIVCGYPEAFSNIINRVVVDVPLNAADISFVDSGTHHSDFFLSRRNLTG